MQNAEVPRRIIIFGEVLVDDFAGRAEVIGGAPLNVAWNLRAINSHPLLVSAIGSDDTGKRILEAIEGWGLATAFVQVDPDRPTGRVLVREERGEPSYQIPSDQAFDFIRHPESLVDSFTDAASPILYHGSLCCRSPVSLESLLHLRRRFESDIAVDINLREEHYTRDLVRQLVDGAAILKCNASELSYLTEQSCSDISECKTAASKLLDQFKLREIWVTDGDRGAFVLSDVGEHHRMDAEKIGSDAFRDTVGAGDAFMAAVLHGRACGHPLRDTLDLAVRMSANACRISGGTTTDSTKYEHLTHSFR